VAQALELLAPICYDASQGEQAMKSTYTAVIKQDANWWIGWIEEVPGVNCQESSREKLLKSLRETLVEAIELNRADALESVGSDFEELSIAV
jgi:predicted RNase H-like HicB family nuclease